MQHVISKIVSDLKSIKISASNIEKELSFSNGLLGKAVNGANLSKERYDKLVAFYEKKMQENGMSYDLSDHENSFAPATNLVVGNTGALKETPTKERVKSVSLTMDKINKDFGAGTVMLFGDRPQKGYDVISTGSISLDKAMGIGGLPRGRMVEIYGPESSGKTTICLHVIANAQKKGLRCLLVDAENSFDPEYASELGVDIQSIMYCQPTFGEEGFEVADRMISMGEVDVVVIDSVAAMVPKGELEGEMGDAKMGLHARLMSQVCRKLVGVVSKRNVLMIFINQIRNKIGVMFGSPEVVTGGMALQFYASVRIDIRKKEALKDGDSVFGHRVKAKVIKNKCAPPMKIAEFDVIHGKGVYLVGEVLDLAVDKGIIQKTGSWYSYSGNKIGQGRENSCQILLDNEDLFNEIYEKLK